jgi:hypothetical protein
MTNQNRRPFTIAISGCSSAGKSTLAFLLAEIFLGKSFLIQRRFAVASLLRRCGFALKRLFLGVAEHYPFSSSTYSGLSRSIAEHSDFNAATSLFSLYFHLVEQSVVDDPLPFSLCSQLLEHSNVNDNYLSLSLYSKFLEQSN